MLVSGKPVYGRVIQKFYRTPNRYSSFRLLRAVTLPLGLFRFREILVIVIIESGLRLGLLSVG